MVLGKLDSCMYINEVRTLPHTILKNKLKNGLKTNIRHDTIKFLEENIGKTFCDINCTNIFLGQSSKAKEIKAKINGT